jgi:hypothetical protein
MGGGNLDGGSEGGRPHDDGWMWNSSDLCWIRGDKRIYPTINAKWMISHQGKYLPGTLARLEEAKAAFKEDTV